MKLFQVLIKKYIKESSLTLETLAERIGVSRTTLHRWSTLKNNPTKVRNSVPRRGKVLALIKLFLSEEIIKTVDDCNQLLEAAGLSLLTSRELEEYNKIDELKPSEIDKNNEFIRAYRLAFSEKFKHWSFRSEKIKSPMFLNFKQCYFEQIYVPLRLSSNENETTRESRTLSADEVKNSLFPILIRGKPGAGKTTLVRKLFKDLIQDGAVIPLYINCENAALDWREKSIIELLHYEIDGHCVNEKWGYYLPTFLKMTTGIKPVLLIDGWDHLETLKEIFVEKVNAFMTEYNVNLFVLTSRPQVYDLPGNHNQRIDRTICPLIDAEVTLISNNFCNHATDKDEAKRNLAKLAKTFHITPNVSKLASRPLYLTMLILLSRNSSIPDKPHRLYQDILNNILSWEENAHTSELLRDYDAWRPSERGSRERYIAEVAYIIQKIICDGKCEEYYVKINHIIEDLSIDSDEPSHKTGFLKWLISYASLLVNHSDSKENEEDRVEFFIPEFREYLSAWLIKETNVYRKEGIDGLFNDVINIRWWGVLILLSSMIDEFNGEEFHIVMKENFINSKGDGTDMKILFAGLSYAEGLSNRKKNDSEKLFKDWVKKFLDVIENNWCDGVERCTQAWIYSNQKERKKILSKEIKKQITTADNSVGLVFLRLIEAATLIDLSNDYSQLLKDVNIPNIWKPVFERTNSQLDFNKASHTDQTSRISNIKFLCGAAPIWPIFNTSLNPGLLQLWPSHRRLVSIRLQLAVNCGANKEDLIKLYPHILPRENKSKNEKLGEDIENKILHEIIGIKGIPIPHQHILSARLTSVLTEYWSCYYQQFDDYEKIAVRLTHYWAYDLKKHYLPIQLNKPVPGTIVSYLTRYMPQLIPEIPKLAKKFGYEKSHPLWLEDFIIIDMSSVGRVASSAILAGQEFNKLERQIEKTVDVQRTKLLWQACRLSLGIDKSIEKFDNVLTQFNSQNDFWTLFACLIAGCATNGNKGQLKQMAEHPEQFKNIEQDLFLGLKYIVRGDIILADGTETTLNNITREAGQDDLPYFDEIW